MVSGRDDSRSSTDLVRLESDAPDPRNCIAGGAGNKEAVDNEAVHRFPISRLAALNGGKRLE